MKEDSPFNSEFCEKLEYHLTEALRQSIESTISKLWCDGILIPAPEHLDKTRVNDKRRIPTTAWLGVDGQTKFEMTVHLGKYALRKYVNGDNLLDTMPSADTLDWIEMDMAKRKIELYLL